MDNQEVKENKEVKKYEIIRSVRDGCYYSCSLINTTNLLLCILIIILLIYIFKK
jgi:hypothetical protein